MNYKSEYNKYRSFRSCNVINQTDFIAFLELNGITIQQNLNELEIIRKFLIKRKSIRSYLEIGSYQGASALYFSLFLLDDSNILLCDSLQAKKSCLAKIHFVKELLENDHRVTLFLKKSKYLRKVLGNNSNMFDLCLIDGRHRICNLIVDLLIVFPHINKDGIILIHDINNYKTYIPYVWYILKRFFKTIEIRSEEAPRAGMGIILKT